MKRTWSQKNTFHGGQFSLLQQTIAKLPTKAHPVGLFPGGKENVETITHPQAHQCSRRESRRLSFVSSDAASSTTDSPLCLGSLSLHSSKQQKTEYYYYILTYYYYCQGLCMHNAGHPARSWAGPGQQAATSLRWALWVAQSQFRSDQCFDQSHSNACVRATTSMSASQFGHLHHHAIWQSLVKCTASQLLI